MSKAALLALHRPEEALEICLDGAITQCVLPTGNSPISEYFAHTQSLIARFVRPEFSQDAEVLSLLILGVVSAAEFYFRSVIVECLSICPFAMKHANQEQIPLGSLQYYGTKTKDLGFSLFEHKSLASANEIKKELNRLVGIQVQPGSSVSAAFSGFDALCELRHAAVHARGFIGSKNATDLGVSTLCVHRIQLNQASVFDLTKLSHNAVRSFNRFVLESILSRWIANQHLSGVWKTDKSRFTTLFEAFSYPVENPFGTDVRAAYGAIQAAIQARMRAR